MTLKRLNDSRASQFYDKDHLVSKYIGEDNLVWDYVAVYPQGKLWEKGPPEPVYSHAPVVRAIDETGDAIRRLLPQNGN